MSGTRKPISEEEFKEHKRDVYFALVVVLLVAIAGIIF